MNMQKPEAGDSICYVMNYSLKQYAESCVQTQYYWYRPCAAPSVYVIVTKEQWRLDRNRVSCQ